MVPPREHAELLLSDEARCSHLPSQRTLLRVIFKPADGARQFELRRDADRRCVVCRVLIDAGAYMPRLSNGERPFALRIVGSAPARSSKEITPACLVSIARCSGLSPGGWQQAN